MRLDDMIGLLERLDRQLPVGLEGFDNMRSYVAVLELPGLDMLDRFLAEIIFQRWRVGIHVDPHKAAQRLHLGFGQAEFCRIGVREIPRADDFLVGAVDVPAPAMEAALELARPADAA